MSRALLPLFWTNLDNVVAQAGSNSISLYLTLSEGRFDWLTNSAMANAYETNCLIPLIQRYKGSSNVFGIDLMNEIDALGGRSGHGQSLDFQRRVLGAGARLTSPTLRLRSTAPIPTGW